MTTTGHQYQVIRDCGGSVLIWIPYDCVPVSPLYSRILPDQSIACLQPPISHDVTLHGKDKGSPG